MKEYYRKCLYFVVGCCLLTASAVAQHLTVNTTQIESLIQQWNVAHNSRDHQRFERFYNHEVIYFAERIPKSRAVLLKKLLFVRNPEYQQKISPDVKYTFYKNGLVKCEFTREVWRSTDNISEPVYLLVGYKHGSYVIVGESDAKTDRELHFRPMIGEALDVEIVSTNPGSASPLFVLSKQASLSPTATIPIRNIPFKGIFFISAVVLIAGGLLLVVKKKSEKHPSTIHNIVEESVATREAYHVSENNRKREAFKTYLLQLFDPMFFKIEKSVSEHHISKEGVDIDPILHLKFAQIGFEPRAIKVCYFYRRDVPDKINLLPLRELEKNRGMETLAQVYYVFGIGGPPEHPTELYLIPADKMTFEAARKEELKPYRKFGLFFFNASRNTLQ